MSDQLESSEVNTSDDGLQGEYRRRENKRRDRMSALLHIGQCAAVLVVIFAGLGVSLICLMHLFAPEEWMYLEEARLPFLLNAGWIVLGAVLGAIVDRILMMSSTQGTGG